MSKIQRVALSAFLALLCTAGIAWAEGGFVQGPLTVGQPVANTNPLYIAGTDGTNLRGLKVDASGNLVSTGGAADGSAASGFPVQIAGKDTSGNAQVPNVTPSGSAATAAAKALLTGSLDPTNVMRANVCDVGGGRFVSQGINAITDTVVNSGTKTSNGVTAVAIVAGVGGKKVYVAHVNAYNTSTTVFHTVTLITSSGATITEVTLSAGNGTSVAGGNWIADDHGFYQTVTADGLSFKIDAAGAAGDVKLTASTVQK